MKRKLITQIKNEWRANIWFIIELAVVLIVIWAILSVLYVQTAGLRSPRGFNPDHVYTAMPKYIRDDNPNHQASEEKGYKPDLADIVRRLRANVNVEAVAIAYSIPYNYNYNGTRVSPADDNDSVIYYANLRQGTPEYVDVLKLKSLTGATSEQLKAMLARGEILLSDNSAYVEEGRDPMSLKGKRVYLSGDSTKTYRVGDIIESIRRNDYELSRAGTIFSSPESVYDWGQLIIRIKPGRESAFESDFKNNPELRRQRNVYLTDLRSMSDLRESSQRGIANQIRTMVLLMLFLLVTIFLGLLGSFWFRMQQRVSEIAIRKVCGATRADIFRRVIGEGMVLLAAAVVIASAIVWPFMDDVVETIGETYTLYLCVELVAAAIVALGILFSLWYPAEKAMRTEPAVAVKAE